MKNTSVAEMWKRFTTAKPIYTNLPIPQYGYFGDNPKDADQLAKLVLKDIKRATSHSLLGLQYRNEPLPKINDLFIVTNGAQKAQCIIKTTSVKLLPFFSVHEEHARLEGEGDKSLDYWKKVHWAYYERELQPFGRVPRESMVIVFERFEKLFE